MGTSSRGDNVHRGRPAWTCRRPCRPHALPLPAVARTLAVPWPAIPGRRGLPGARPRAAADQGRPLMRDVTGAGPPGTAIAGVVGSGRTAPRRRELTSGTSRARGEESALLLSSSLTAAGEPHPLPMERTSLTVSVVIWASTRNVGRFSHRKSTVSVPSC